MSFDKATCCSAIERLTPREREVLSLLAQGNQRKMIADELGITFFCVVKHCEHIFKKLDVHSAVEATIVFHMAQANGELAPLVLR